MSFIAGDNITIPKNTWVKISEASSLDFQIKTEWTNPIYYYEGLEDLADPVNVLGIKLKDPKPEVHEIGIIQSGRKAEIENFRNVSYVNTTGALWIFIKDNNGTVLKGI